MDRLALGAPAWQLNTSSTTSRSQSTNHIAPPSVATTRPTSVLVELCRSADSCPTITRSLTPTHLSPNGRLVAPRTSAPAF